MFKIYTSGLARVMQCAGFLHFKDLPVEPQNDAAAEGQAAGELLEYILTNKPIGEVAKNGVRFDNDMKFHAEETAKNIMSLAESEVLCEVPVHWKTRAGIEIRGKYDASFVSKGVLYIDDYKYGWGIVEPEGNWQLLGYNIGEIIRRKTAFSEIVLRIHQPRPYHEAGPTREWRITYDQLIKYKEEIESRMAAIAAGENSLNTGPQCKYCPAASACPAFNKAYFASVEAVSHFVQDTLSDEVLSAQLDMIGRIEDLVKTRKGSLEQLAVSRIKEGKLIPGYACTESYGHRKWKSNIKPEVIEALTGVNVLEQVMVSPAKAEKLGVPKDIMKQMAESPSLGAKLKRVATKEMGNKIFGNQQPAIQGV